jgi:hypothetical protein
MMRDSIAKFILVLFCFSSLAHAKPLVSAVEFLGLKFQVESIKTLGSNDRQVSLFGKTVVSKDSDLPLYVADQYFSRGELQEFGDDELLDFYGRLTKSHYNSLVIKSSIQLIKRWAARDEQLIQIAQHIRSTPNSKRLLFDIFACDWLTTLGAKMPLLLMNLSRPSSKMGLGQSIDCGLSWIGVIPSFNRVLEYHLNQRDLPKGLGVAKLFQYSLIRHSLKQKDVRHARRLLRRLSLFSAILRVPNIRKIEATKKLFSSVARHGSIERAVQLFTRNSIAKVAGKKAKQDAVSSLQLLSVIPTQFFTYEMLANVKSATLGLTPGQFQSLFADKQPLLLLLWLARRDKHFAQGFCYLLEGLIRANLGGVNGNNSNEVVKLVELLRQDTSPGNDLLLYRIALTVLSEGDKRLADLVLEEVKQPLSWHQIANLGLKGYYMPVWLILIIAIAPLAIGGFIFAVTRKNNFGQSRRTVGSVDDLVQEDFDIPAFVAPVARVDPRIKELQRLYEELGVSSHANFRDLKSAYRSKIKMLHPDHGAPQTAATQKEFQKVQSTYDRIIELRQELNMGE